MDFISTNRMGQKVENEIIVIDLGTRVTKAVSLRRLDGKIQLLGYTFQEISPTAARASVEWLSGHLREIWESLGTKTKQVILVVGLSDSIIRPIELPLASKSEMRRMIKLNPKAFLQEDVENYIFDCCGLFESVAATSDTGRTHRKIKALVGGAKEDFVNVLRTSAKFAGLTLRSISLGKIAPANAFMLMPEEFKTGVVALVHIGYSGSTISFLSNGELLLIREVSIGDQKLTTELAESLNVNYQVAEAVKLTMPNKILAKLQLIIAPLARELRTSIDFCEHQYEKTVSRIFLSGGPTRSAILLQALQAELHLPCSTWNPKSYIDFELASQQVEKLELEMPQLFVALGAGAAYFHPELPSINLLAEEQERAEVRRRDPIKRVALISSLLVMGMFVWMSYLMLLTDHVERDSRRYQSELKAVQDQSTAITRDSVKTSQIQATLASLGQLVSNRFRWAPTLYAFQNSMVADIQVLRLTGEREALFTPASRAVTNRSGKIIPARPPTTREKITFSIQAKDTGDPPAMEKFMRTIAANPYFQIILRPEDPVLLKNRMPAQADPDNPNKSFIIFTIECYVERVFQ